MLDHHDRIRLASQRAAKQARNATGEAKRRLLLKARYYAERIHCAAIGSFEQFIGSWAGEMWEKQQVDLTN